MYLYSLHTHFLNLKQQACNHLLSGRDHCFGHNTFVVLKRPMSIKPASNFVLLFVPSQYFCGGSFCFMSWCLKYFFCCWRLMYVFIFLVKLR